MTDFSRLLNPEQLEAATAGDGPLLVLAAAGRWQDAADIRIGGYGQRA